MEFVLEVHFRTIPPVLVDKRHEDEIRRGRITRGRRVDNDEEQAKMM